jgi:hypothetical protein
LVGLARITLVVDLVVPAGICCMTASISTTSENVRALVGGGREIDVLVGDATEESSIFTVRAKLGMFFSDAVPCTDIRIM